MATLPTNFKDDILDTSVNTRRRYRVYENTDGTIGLEDVTEYSQVGDVFGSGQINATNTEVNKKFDKNMLVRDLDTINAITKEGYAPDALALKEVNDSLKALTVFEQEIIGTNAILYKNGKYRELHLCGYDVVNGSSVGIPIKPEDTPNYLATGCVAVMSNSNIAYGQFGYYNGGSVWRLWSSDGSNTFTGKVSGVVTWIVE